MDCREAFWSHCHAAVLLRVMENWSSQKVFRMRFGKSGRGQKSVGGVSGIRLDWKMERRVDQILGEQGSAVLIS